MKYCAPGTLDSTFAPSGRLSDEAVSTSLEEGSYRTTRKGVPFVTYLSYLLLLLIIVSFASVRFRLRETPLERDEGEFAYSAQLILQGVTPYQMAYTMKLPGTAVMYAGMMALFGQTSAGIHTGLILANAITIILMFQLAKRLFANLAGLIAAASYALLSTAFMGFAAHATHFVVLFALAGTLVLLRALEAQGVGLFFLSGLFFGLAYLMKQPGLFFLLFAGIYLVQQQWSITGRRKKLPAELAALIAGGALPLAVTCLLIWRSGTFPRFWFWTFNYARDYGTIVSPFYGIAVFLQSLPLAAVALAIVLSVASLIAVFVWSEHARAPLFFIISFSVLSFAAVLPGFYFRAHYFILVLPAVSLTLGMIVSCASEALGGQFNSPLAFALPLVLFVGFYAAAIVHYADYFFYLTPAQAARQTYGMSPFLEAVAVSDYIAHNSPPGATVAVLGSEPEIYFYSHRRSATGYIYTYPLMEPQKYARGMQQDMIHEIELARPDYLVYVNARDSWISVAGGHPVRDIVTWMDTYMREYYSVVGVADIGRTTEYRWGTESKEYVPRSDSYILVLKRESS